MIVTRSFRLSALFRFAWPNALRTLILSTVVWAAYEFGGLAPLAIPFLPVATIGTAVAFYVGFKNNSSYERMWEARKIWGSIVNISRHFASSVISLVGHRQCDEVPAEHGAVIHKLVYRHLAWVNILRLQLRRPSPLNASAPHLPQYKVVAKRVAAEPSFEEEVDTHLRTFDCAREAEELAGKQNIANHLMQLQLHDLIALKRRGWLDAFEHRILADHIVECLNAQGAAERIKFFPFPRQYANFSSIFVNIFIFLLPFGLLGEFATIGDHFTWMIIPFSLLISWVFYSMEQVGDASENPFENAVNDVPLTAMCRNIEVDLKELLKEEELPPKYQPVDGILL